ncbi:MAG: bifunctional phosphoglucose/phosphomannose isomerase [Actinobacteria bacterium]|jgi:glucose/mannose-6-phosphate isomerase|nr:MAG: bifunctional phosphoglucose/phosphomannose isomerase [Actinomycetota bacterium]
MVEAINLDDVMSLEERDPGGMLAAIESFSKQVTEALRLGRDQEEIPPKDGITRIAHVGMGGSAIGGDILSSLLEDAVGMPISVYRSYRLPSLLGPDTLAIFASYSGNTEETLSALEDAIYLGCKILAITTGGMLLDMAGKYRFPAIMVPTGLQPRAALPYLSLPAAAVLEKMGLLQGFVKVAYETADFLRGKREDWGRLTPVARNFAKQLAIRLHGKIPVVYGTYGILSVAAYRWKCQFNENSKVPAFHHTIPEMNHNEIVGWYEQNDFSRKVEIIMLVEEGDTSRVAKRVEVSAEILQDRVGGVTVIHVGGRTRTERLLSAIHLGDFVSGYLALLNGVDPTPVESIALLKERMAEE